MYISTSELIPSALSREEAIRIIVDDTTGLSDGEIDALIDTAVTAAGTDADAEIDSYIGRVVTLPIDPTPQVLKAQARRMYVFYLYSKRAGLAIPEDVKDLYEKAITWLKLVNRGDAGLGVTPPPPPPQSEGAQFSGDDRVFTSGTMGGF